MNFLGTIRCLALATALAICVGGVASIPVGAQSPTGPQTPAVKPPDVVRIPNNPGPSADIPAIPRRDYLALAERKTNSLASA